MSKIATGAASKGTDTAASIIQMMFMQNFAREFQASQFNHDVDMAELSAQLSKDFLYNENRLNQQNKSMNTESNITFNQFRRGSILNPTVDPETMSISDTSYVPEQGLFNYQDQGNRLLDSDDEGEDVLFNRASEEENLLPPRDIENWSVDLNSLDSEAPLIGQEQLPNLDMSAPALSVSNEQLDGDPATLTPTANAIGEGLRNRKPPAADTSDTGFASALSKLQKQFIASRDSGDSIPLTNMTPKTDESKRIFESKTFTPSNNRSESPTAPLKKSLNNESEV